jgi:hypothetical protein
MVFTSGSLNAIVAHLSVGMQLSKGLSLNVDSFFYGDKKRPMDSILKPCCWHSDPNGEPIVSPRARHPFVPPGLTHPASSLLWRDK